MIFFEKLRFVFSAMLAKGRRSIAFAIVVTLSVICMTWTVVTGLLEGAECVSRDRIERRPLTSRLFLGNEQMQPKLVPAQISMLEENVRQELDSRLELVSPARVLNWRLKSEGDTDFVEMKGRTIKLGSGTNNHPILRDVGLKHDWSDQNRNGVYLCPGIYKKASNPLFWNENAPPRFIDIDTYQPDTRGAVKVAVSGVLSYDPPEDVYFLCPEDLAVELESMNKLKQTVLLSPLDPSWLTGPDDDEGMKLIRSLPDQMLEREESTITMSAMPNFENSTLRLTLGNEALGWTEEVWKDFAKKLRKELDLQFKKAIDAVKHSNGPTIAPLSKILDVDSLSKTNPVPSYPIIEMFFTDPDALPIAADILRHEPLLEGKGKIDRNTAELVSQLQSFTKAKVVTLQATKVGLLVICLVCLMIIQFLRCMDRRSEAGMLKAMGLSNSRLMWIFVWETTILWLVGAACGTAIGKGIGAILASRLYAGNPFEVGIGFHFPMADILGVSLGTWFVANLSGQIAALWIWYIRQPADLLEEH